MQTIYVPVSVDRCGYVAKSYPCLNRRAKGSRYCKRHAAVVEKENAESGYLAQRAEKARQWFPGWPLTNVYFIRQGESGPVKIGKADSIADRMASLQTASPYKLKLLAALLAPAELEGALHLALDDRRLEGEWFSWCPEIEVLILLAKTDAMQSIAHFVGWDWPVKSRADSPIAQMLSEIRQASQD